VLEQSIGEIVALVVEVVRTGAVPPFGDVEQARRTSAARSAQGVPIHEIMRAFRFTLGGIHDALIASAEATGLPPADLIEITNALWRFSDAYTASQVAVYQASEVDRALARARVVQEFLQNLVEGRYERAVAVSLGVDPDAEYHAVRSGAHVGWEAEDGLSAVVGGGLVGICAGMPRPLEPGGVVAMGEAAPLPEMATSFRAAAAVLAAAEMLGKAGVVTVSGLGWRLAAVRSDEVNRLLSARYLEPLRAQGPFGDLIADSVRAYLRADRNVPRAARRIPVHANTLRYRLRRFEELTGCSLESTDTIIEASFAFEVNA
jgi:putative transposase